MVSCCSTSNSRTDRDEKQDQTQLLEQIRTQPDFSSLKVVTERFRPRVANPSLGRSEGDKLIQDSSVEVKLRQEQPSAKFRPTRQNRSLRSIRVCAIFALICLVVAHRSRLGSGENYSGDKQQEWLAWWNTSIIFIAFVPLIVAMAATTAANVVLTSEGATCILPGSENGGFLNGGRLLGLTWIKEDGNEQCSEGGVLGGLVNNGNTCFANSVIQGLASCFWAEDFIKSVTNRMANESHIPSNTDNSSDLSHVLYDIISDLNRAEPSRHSHNPARLLRALKSGKWTDGDQQDAHEFLLSLLDGIRNELESDLRLQRKSLEAIDTSTRIIQLHEELPSFTLSSVKSRVVPEIPDLPLLPLDGVLTFRVTCRTCGEMQAERQSIFSSVELPLSGLGSISSVPGIGSTSIDELLKRFLADEVLDNVHCQRCSLRAAEQHLTKLVGTAVKPEIGEILRARRDAIVESLACATITDSEFERLKPPRLIASQKIKALSIARWPKVLALHVNRSIYDVRAGLARKQSYRVDYNAKLSITAIGQKSPENQCIEYELSAIVVHFGSHSFGHYIAYRRKGNDWFRISDKDVRRVPPELVFREQHNVVLLFYERDLPTMDLSIKL
ncbi:hypothetical protein V1511DRAFT_504025 [Dipodascopsis uninucleata]